MVLHTYSLPPVPDIVWSRSDPEILKDPCLFYKSDGFRGCFVLSQYTPKVVRSWDVAEYLVPELSMSSALQQDVQYVCRPSPHGHLSSATPGTLCLWRKCLVPIFSVRIPIKSALCLLLSFVCSCNTFLVGFGVYRKLVLPRVSFVHLFAQASLACL